MRQYRYKRYYPPILTATDNLLIQSNLGTLPGIDSHFLKLSRDISDHGQFAAWS